MVLYPEGLRFPAKGLRSSPLSVIKYTQIITSQLAIIYSKIRSMPFIKRALPTKSSLDRLVNLLAMMRKIAMYYKSRTNLCFHVVGIAFIMVVFLFGCGGGSNSNSNSPPSTSLTANAGVDQTAAENTVVQLDGSQSSDVNGTIQTYQWKQLSGPTIALSNADTANPSLTTPVITTDTELIFELTVTDDLGKQDTDDVSILVLDNVPPVADAGVDQQVLASQVVNLNGTLSHDDDGSIVSYLWTQVGGSSVVGDPGFDTSSPTPSFTAPASGEKLSFRLTVTDDLGMEDTDEVDIYVSGVLFSDDFSQGLNETVWVKVDDSAGTGNNSSWIISGNALQQNNNVDRVSQGPAFDESFHKGTYRYLNTTTTLTDYRVQVDVTPLPDASSGELAGNDIGIMFRYQNNNNYYRLSMNYRYGFTRLEKKIGGQFHSLATNSIGYFEAIPSEFIIEMKGSLIQVFIDNDPIFSVIDSDLTSGSVALYCQGKTRFDNVLLTDANLMPRVVVATPMAYMVATTNISNLNVNAHVANLPASGWVEFLLNDGNARTDTQAPFTAQFNGLAPGDYTVTAVLRDADGNELSRDTNQVVGVRGGFYIAAGNSITNGSGDFFEGDNLSNDGRTVGRQGYEAALNDQLTSYLGLPHIVFNEGIPGDTTAMALGRINSILSRHAQAKNVLLLLGTNDSDNGVSAADYGNNMQSLVNTINNAGMTPWVAKVPPQVNATTGLPNTTANNRIQGYNAELTNLTNAQEGPDFYSYFLNNTGLFSDAEHPNSLGHACMTRLWRNAITGATDTPFILKQLQTPEGLYQQNLLEAGDLFYIDENYTLENLPQPLFSAIWIMTANGDATNISTSYLSFNLDRTATVYVAYDARNGVVLPGWMSSFTNTGQQIDTTAGMFDLYSRLYNAGSVTLPGNRADKGTGQLNYFVAVVD
jgi:lysophospholipase L1-like esterase